MAQMLWLVIDFNRWTCTITHYLCSLGPLPPYWWLVPCCSVGLGDRMWEGVSLVETMVIPPDRPPEWRFRDLARRPVNGLVPKPSLFRDSSLQNI
jgi:hypothetical protein